MPRKVYTPLQIVNKLGRIERLVAGGKALPLACRQAGVSAQSYNRWRKDYGTLARRLDKSEQNIEIRNRELAESLEQQSATAEILRVISRSHTDLQPVFDTIVRNAGALCKGFFANVFRFDGEKLHFIASSSTSETLLELLRTQYPMRPGVSQMSGRAVLAKEVVRLEDALADPQYDRRPHCREAGGERWACR